MNKYNVIQMDYQGEISRYYQKRDLVRIEKSMTIVVQDGVTEEQAREMLELLKEKMMVIIELSKRG